MKSRKISMSEITNMDKISFLKEECEVEVKNLRDFFVGLSPGMFLLDLNPLT